MANHAGAAATLEGTAGAGRICLALAELGIPLDAVIQAVVDPDAEPAELDATDLGDRFDLVVLGSHLVNLPSDEARAGILRLAGRHATDEARSRVLVEHHPLDWAETAEATDATPGSTIGMEEVRRDPPFVSAVSTFDVGGRYVRQPFTARVLSDVELDAALEGAGLARRSRLGPTWIEAARTTIGA